MKKTNKIISVFIALVLTLGLMLQGCDKDPTKLETPQNLEISANELTFDGVANADSYIIKVGDQEHPTTQTQFSLDQNLQKATAHKVSVKAIGSGSFTDSDWSNEIDYIIVQQLSAPLATLQGDNLEWTAVQNAQNYTVSITSPTTQEFTQTTTQTSLNILQNIDTVSNYTIKVKSNGDNTFYTDSEWSTTTNYQTSSLNFDTNGGNTLSPIIAKIGSQITLPTPTNPNPNLVFIGWYKESTLKNEYTATTMPATPTTIYAQWLMADQAPFTYSTSSTSATITGISPLGQTLLSLEGKLTIPTTYQDKPVTAIASRAFSNLTQLQEIIIPSNVQTIGNSAFSYCTALTQVTISGNGLTTLGNNVFESCESLNSITFPQSLTQIGSGIMTFSGIYDNTPNNQIISAGEWVVGVKGTLSTAITISQQVGIANGAFSGAKITSITIGESVKYIGDTAFMNCMELTQVAIANGTQIIGERAFYGCTALTQVDMGSGILHIKNMAFSGCTQLQNLSINANSQLLTIGDSAFFDCTKLTQIQIPQNVNSIGEKAFYNCTSLANVEFLGNELTKLSNYTFFRCTSLSTIDLPQAITIIPQYAFSESGIKSINLENITKVDRYAFYLSSLESVDFGTQNNLNSIEYFAFSGCVNLTEVTLPSSLSYLGYGCFSGCIYLLVELKNSTPIILEEGYPFGADYNYFVNLIFVPEDAKDAYRSAPVWNGYTTRTFTHSDIKGGGTYIEEDNAFIRYIGKVDTFTVPAGITSIAPRAFYYNKTIKHLTISNDVESIGASAFYQASNLQTVTMGTGLKTIDIDAFAYCRKLNKVEVLGNLETIGSWAFLACNSLKSIKLDGVTSIGNLAFSQTSLSDFTLSEGLTSIGEYAFSACPIPFIQVPSTVTSIGTGAFESIRGVITFATATVPTTNAIFGTYEPQVKAVIVPNGSVATYKTAWDAVKNKVYENANLVANEYVYSETTFIAYIGWAKHYTIPSQFDTIGQYAFVNCTSLATITIPSTVTAINMGAMESVYSAIVFESAVAPTLHAIFGNATPLSKAMIIPNGSRESYEETTGSSKSKLYEQSQLTNGYIIDNTTLVAYISQTPVQDFTLTGITKIQAYAFANVDSIGTITLDGLELTQIGQGAFYNFNGQINIQNVTDDSLWDASWKDGCNATISYI